MQFPELKYDFDYSIAELADGLSIAYTDSGSGTTGEVIIFIHGLSSYIPAFSKIIPRLKDKFRCIAIDLPGYGKSSSGIYSGTMAFYAETIASFIKKLNIDKVILAGHSMGGQIAVTASLLYPQFVEKLILLAPAGLEKFTEEEIGRLLKNNNPNVYANADDRQIEYNYSINFFKMGNDVQFMINDRKKMKECENFMNYCTTVSNSLKGMLDYSISDKLDRIKQETLIIFGLNDRFIPQPVLHGDISVKEIAMGAASEIKNAKLVLIEECGHFLQFEKAEETAGEIIKFLG